MKASTETFFTRDPSFYKTLFSLMIVVSLQNLIAYSVNMTDNIMLGAYSQDALSGAATVNQIFFMVQQITLALGEALVMLGSQYWGLHKVSPIRRLTGIAVKAGFIIGAVIVLICHIIPVPILKIFTNNLDIIAEGVAYLSIVKYSFILFIITNILIAALRSVEIVKISFCVSVISLIINVFLNYGLIFGNFGMPELGITGAAIGTLISRVIELIIVVFYFLKIDDRLQLFSESFMKADPALRHDYRKSTIPVVLSNTLWAVSVPMQTAILGHLPGGVASDVIAANSVAITFYQYLKVIIVAMSSTSAVMIGKAIGQNNLSKVKQDARTLSVFSVLIGAVLALLLFILRAPLLSLYNLNSSAFVLADQFMVVMCFVMLGMSYQMPVSFGIIRGGGDPKFTLIMCAISTWAIVMPLSLMSAFWWKLPAVWVVLVIQSDQIFKGLPTFLHFRKYKWIKKLTRDNA